MRKGEDKGGEEGREEGHREEAERLLLRLFAHRFGEVPASLQTQLHKLTLLQLEPLVDAVLSSQSLVEFIAQVPSSDEATPSA